MPFCTQCGNTVGERDTFCANCGSKQEYAARPPSGSMPGPAGSPATDYLGDMSARTAALLCYVPLMGWIASIFVLASNRFREDRNTRFHAFQGLYLFVAWLMVDWVLKPVMRVSHVFGDVSLIGLVKAVLFGAWIWMMVKVSHNETFKLPLVGELAEKSVTEQR